MLDAPELPEHLQAIAVPTDRPQEDRWLLALVALGIPHQVMVLEDGAVRALVVLRQDADRALTTIQEVDAEQREKVEESKKPAPEKTPQWAYMVAQLWILAFVLVSLAPDLREIGHLQASEVLHGRYASLFTAITLHGDGAHLLGNMAFLALVGTSVIHRMGPGISAIALVFGGAAGNIFSSWVYGAHHTNVGASGGIFALLGLWGMMSARTRESRIGRNRWMLGAGAALALLSMFGFGGDSEMGSRTDIMAHLGGFFAAVPLGLIAPIRTRETRTIGWWALQVVLGGGALATLGIAWLRVLGRI